MAIVLTGGQSWDELAAQYTLSPAYGPGIANYNNMTGQSITGKKFRIEIPDTWMKPAYAGKQIDLMNVAPGIPTWVIMALGAGLLFLVK